MFLSSSIYVMYMACKRVSYSEFGKMGKHDDLYKEGVDVYSKELVLYKKDICSQDLILYKGFSFKDLTVYKTTNLEKIKIQIRVCGEVLTRGVVVYNVKIFMQTGLIPGTSRNGSYFFNSYQVHKLVIRYVGEHLPGKAGKIIVTKSMGLRYLKLLQPIIKERENQFSSIREDNPYRFLLQ